MEEMVVGPAVIEGARLQSYCTEIEQITVRLDTERAAYFWAEVTLELPACPPGCARRAWSSPGDRVATWPKNAPGTPPPSSRLARKCRYQRQDGPDADVRGARRSRSLSAYLDGARARRVNVTE